MTAFRKEHEFSYETTSPGGLDDRTEGGYGYTPFLDDSERPPLTACQMKSNSNSIRMTSMAYRFKPMEFPALKLKLKVLQGVPGADPAFGGSGKDDSAFQVWFSFRQLRPGIDRRHVDPNETVRIFGYYWADPNASGKMPEPGDLIQNYYSNKNFVIATLPEAWQVALSGGKANEGSWKEFSRNLAEDMKKAYPKLDPAETEIIAITFQTDSNDVAGRSEALFRHLTIEPK
jgi:hypothetical protein